VEEERGGPAGPHLDLEVIRVEAGMPTASFCELIGMPERTWRRHQCRARADRATKGPWPRPVRASVSMTSRSRSRVSRSRMTVGVIVVEVRVMEQLWVVGTIASGCRRDTSEVARGP